MPLVSDPPVIVACQLALAGLPPGLLRWLSLAGGALLVYLGTVTLRELWREPPELAGDAAASAGEGGAGGAGVRRGAPPATAGFWRAVLVNLLNPNAWIFWSLVGGPILAGALRGEAVASLAFLGPFYLSLTGTNVATVLVFGAVGRLGPRAARALGGLSALAFLGLGLVQLVRFAA